MPLDGRPKLGSAVRAYRGDSRGRWEGDTMVIETTNYSEKTAWRGSSENLKVTERLTMTSPTTDPVSVHRRGPVDVDAAVERRVRDDPHRGPAVRVRVSRGELPAAVDPEGRAARRGEGGGEPEVTSH